jgi:serine O-acetyltransferase
VAASLQVRALLSQIHEDWVAADRSWTRPGVHALAVYRFGRWARALPAPFNLVGNALHQVLYNVVRVVHGIQLPLTADIGRRLRIAHYGSVIVGDWSRIGDDCLLRHNVTLGARDTGRKKEAPVLEDGVKVGPGVVIMGAVTVGAGTKIGPNAVVYTDVPPGSRVFAAPAVIRPPRGADSGEEHAPVHLIGEARRSR